MVGGTYIVSSATSYCCTIDRLTISISKLSKHGKTEAPCAPCDCNITRLKNMYVVAKESIILHTENSICINGDIGIILEQVDKTVHKSSQCGR